MWKIYVYYKKNCHNNIFITLYKILLYESLLNFFLTNEITSRLIIKYFFRKYIIISFEKLVMNSVIYSHTNISLISMILKFILPGTIYWTIFFNTYIKIVVQLIFKISNKNFTIYIYYRYNLWKSIPTTLILRKSNLKKIFLSNS